MINTKEIIDFELVELTTNEQEKINGGSVMVAIFLAAMAIGYMAGSDWYGD